MPELPANPPRRCARCQAEAPDTAANFCEECGAPLAPAPAAAPPAVALRTDCPGCGSIAPPEDGFCPACGLERVPAANARDHFEEARGDVLAAVSDLGRRHARNEDFFALATGDDAGRVLIAVVCDGVSNSQRPDEASAAAARAAVASLSAAAPGGRLAADAPARLREAVAEAQAAVVALPPSAVVSVGDDGNPLDSPASTLVAAVVRGRELDLIWLGDSRGYFIAGTTGPAVPITHDHTWFNAVVDAGKMSVEEAIRAPEAHTVLRSLGGPSPNGAAGDEPSLAHFTAPADGWLLLCSDGLWNYARDPATVAHLIRAAVGDAVAAADPQPLRRAARSLVDFALRAGGRDNVTVALTRIQG